MTVEEAGKVLEAALKRTHAELLERSPSDIGDCLTAPVLFDQMMRKREAALKVVAVGQRWRRIDSGTEYEITDQSHHLFYTGDGCWLAAEVIVEKAVMIRSETEPYLASPTTAKKPAHDYSDPYVHRYLRGKVKTRVCRNCLAMEATLFERHRECSYTPEHEKLRLTRDEDAAYGMVEHNLVYAEDRMQDERFRDPCGPPEPMRSGVGGIACRMTSTLK